MGTRSIVRMPPLGQIPKFSLVALAKPGSEKREIVALEGLGEGKEAPPSLAPASCCSTVTWPAVATGVVDEVVDRELTVGPDVTQGNHVDRVSSEAEIYVRIAAVIEIAIWTSY
jgi:hypothetical protein